jgi:membrane-associated phospholipid phosphatase
MANELKVVALDLPPRTILHVNGERKRNLILFFTLWVGLLIVAFAMDRAVAEWVARTVPFDGLGKVARRIIRLPGYFPFTLAIAALLAFIHPRRMAAAISLILSGIAAGALYSVIKWTVGRHRPIVGIHPFRFTPFPGGFLGLFHAEKALCFPSGDATLAFATAASLAILLPRGRWAWYAAAVIVAAERVLENAHYVSDVVAGAGIGVMAGAIITRWVLANTISKRLAAL